MPSATEAGVLRAVFCKQAENANGAENRKTAENRVSFSEKEMFRGFP
jgi:hypothetical protein